MAKVVSQGFSGVMANLNIWLGSKVTVNFLIYILDNVLRVRVECEVRMVVCSLWILSSRRLLLLNDCLVPEYLNGIERYLFVTVTSCKSISLSGQWWPCLTIANGMLYSCS